MGIGLYRLYRLFRPPYNCTALTEKARSDVRFIRSISERPLKHVLSTTLDVNDVRSVVPVDRTGVPVWPPPARARRAPRRRRERRRAPAGTMRAPDPRGAAGRRLRGPRRPGGRAAVRVRRSRFDPGYAPGAAGRRGRHWSEDRRMWGKHTNSTQATHTHTH